MAHRNQGLSRTLPKNFTFPSLDADEPKTPEPDATEPDGPPPPPRHSSCRLNRFRARSGTDVFAQAEYGHSMPVTRLPDIPLPSIEFPPLHDAPTPAPSSTIPANDRFLAPPRDQLDMMTPPAQIRATPIDPSTTGAWEYQHWGNSIKRPSSVCSNSSVSSVSSVETSASRPSIGGSCTSMESESQDPFWYLETPRKQIIERPASPPKPRQRPLPKERWTLEMDNHLWNIYQLHLQDPTITPFKMTPGSIPPLGVTHRVARQAKKTWAKSKLGQFSLSKKSPNTTPTGKSKPAKPSWPRSETSTRRRLKLLCRRKFSIAPHYQRMMQSRSPTPFLEAFARSSRESSRVNASTGCGPYTTRDLGVSLVSTSAPGQLSLLAADEPLRSPAGDSFGLPAYNPQNYAVEHPVEKSAAADDKYMVPRLGSPFKYQTWGPGRSKRRAQPSNATGRRGTIHVTEPRFRLPAQFDPVPTLKDQLSAQGQVDMESSSPMADDTRHRLEDLFHKGNSNESGQRRVRIRNRGATTSSVNSGGLEQLFSPPSSMASMQHEENVHGKPANPFRNISEDHTKRLGSPFKLDGLPREFPGKFIRHAPSRSDPFLNGVPLSDEELAEFASGSTERQP